MFTKFTFLKILKIKLSKFENLKKKFMFFQIILSRIIHTKFFNFRTRILIQHSVIPVRIVLSSPTLPVSRILTTTIMHRPLNFHPKHQLEPPSWAPKQFTAEHFRTRHLHSAATAIVVAFSSSIILEWKHDQRNSTIGFTIS